MNKIKHLRHNKFLSNKSSENIYLKTNNKHYSMYNALYLTGKYKTNFFWRYKKGVKECLCELNYNNGFVTNKIINMVLR